MKLMLKNQPLPPPPPAPGVCLGPTGIRPLTGRLTWEDLITVIFILVFVVVVVLLLLLSMFVAVADSLSGSSYRLSQTLSLFLSECLIMTHRLWQDIWITLEAARLQMEADPVRQSLSNIYQWSVEAIFHCSHLLFNSVPEVSSFMSSSKLLDVSSEYFTMMHCFNMIVSNCGKVFSIFLISIDFLVKLMFHVNRLFFRVFSFSQTHAFFIFQYLIELQQEKLIISMKTLRSRIVKSERRTKISFVDSLPLPLFVKCSPLRQFPPLCHLLIGRVAHSAVLLLFGFGFPPLGSPQSTILCSHSWAVRYNLLLKQ